MSQDIQLERLYERITLTRGIGYRRSGELCLMSLVALLAGEDHTDQPRTASPLIRRFAIPLNDGMDTSARQKLKPFAPRIIGTSDRRDTERAAVLHDAIFAEVFPRAFEDRQLLFIQRGCIGSAKPLHMLLSRIADLPADQSPATLDALEGDDAIVLAGFRRVAKAYRSGLYGEMAETAAHLLIRLALAASERDRDAWYWSKAIDLLDRLCEVGADERAAALRPERLAEMAAVFDHRPAAGSALARLRTRLKRTMSIVHA